MTNQRKCVSYLRVSTTRQGESGLGIEAQRSSVTNYLSGDRWKVVGEFVEVESGRNNHRPELQKAITTCRIHGATLVVSRLDRLARNAHFLLGLKEAGIEILCVDMPSANALTIGIMAMVAQEEARLISARTKAALAMAKQRGVKLGSPQPITTMTQRNGRMASALIRQQRWARWVADVRPTVESMMRECGSLRRTALGLPHGEADTATSHSATACEINDMRDVRRLMDCSSGLPIGTGVPISPRSWIAVTAERFTAAHWTLNSPIPAEEGATKSTALAVTEPNDSTPPFRDDRKPVIDCARGMLATPSYTVPPLRSALIGTVSSPTTCVFLMVNGSTRHEEMFWAESA